MKTDVVRLKALPGYQLEVTLLDGRLGRLDMTPYLDFGVFKQLREPGYFAQVDVQFGAVTWPGGQDIAPETLLDRIQFIRDLSTN